MTQAQVFLTFDRCGLLCSAWIEATDSPVATIADASGRGSSGGTMTTSRIVPKRESFGRSLYLSADEQSDLTLWHDCRLVVERVRAGQLMTGGRRLFKITTVWSSIGAWLQNRSFNASFAGVALGAGWWRRGSSQPDLAELTALLRCFDRVVNSPDAESDESPWADFDNGRYDHAITM